MDAAFELFDGDADADADGGASTDSLGGSSTDSSTLADGSSAAANSTIEIPAASLGMITMPGSYHEVYSGWTYSCSPYTQDRNVNSQKSVTLAQVGTGVYAVTSTLHFDTLNGTPLDHYTIQLSAAMPTVQNGDPSTCDPIYGICVSESWTLTAHSLVLQRASLHDNSSTTPNYQCDTYYYDKITGTYQWSW